MTKFKRLFRTLGGTFISVVKSYCLLLRNQVRLRVVYFRVKHQHLGTGGRYKPPKHWLTHERENGSYDAGVVLKHALLIDLCTEFQTFFPIFATISSFNNDTSKIVAGRTCSHTCILWTHGNCEAIFSKISNVTFLIKGSSNLLYFEQYISIGSAFAADEMFSGRTDLQLHSTVCKPV